MCFKYKDLEKSDVLPGDGVVTVRIEKLKVIPGKGPTLSKNIVILYCLFYLSRSKIRNRRAELAESSIRKIQPFE